VSDGGFRRASERPVEVLTVPKKTRTARRTAKPATAKAPARTKARKATRAAGKKPAKAISPEAMMAAWQKTMNPSDGHRRLEPLVGTFAVKATMWMAPGAPPMVSDAVSEHHWVLGGRQLEQIFRGNMMGEAFEGRGYTGYDNVQKKYVGTWMDSMGTGIMTSASVGKPTDQKITFECTCHEPLVGASRMRAVVKIVDQDHHIYEMWRMGPTGKEFRTMLCEYARK
jgi:hypothetical protein